MSRLVAVVAALENTTWQVELSRAPSGRQKWRAVIDGYEAWERTAEEALSVALANRLTAYVTGPTPDEIDAVGRG